MTAKSINVVFPTLLMSLYISKKKKKQFVNKIFYESVLLKIIKYIKTDKIIILLTKDFYRILNGYREKIHYKFNLFQ